LEAFFKAEEGGDLDGVEEWKEIRASRSAAFAGSSAIVKLWRDGFRAAQFLWHICPGLRLIPILLGNLLFGLIQNRFLFL